jgi:hypothetical protein
MSTAADARAMSNDRLKLLLPDAPLKLSYLLSTLLSGRLFEDQLAAWLEKRLEATNTVPYDFRIFMW